MQWVSFECCMMLYFENSVSRPNWQQCIMPSTAYSIHKWRCNMIYGTAYSFDIYYSISKKELLRFYTGSCSSISMRCLWRNKKSVFFSFYCYTYLQFPSRNIHANKMNTTLRILHYCQMRLSSDHMGNASRSSATTYRMLRKVLSYILDFSVRIQTTFSLSFGRDIQVISQWVIVAERNTVFLPATMSRGKAGETKKYLQPSCGRHPWIRTYFRSHHESNMILY